jgi:hypothetical protein
VICTEGQHYEVHHQKHSNAIEQSADEEVIAQKTELAAGDAVNRGGGESNKVMDPKPKQVRTHSRMPNRSADQTSCDS